MEISSWPTAVHQKLCTVTFFNPSITRQIIMRYNYDILFQGNFRYLLSKILQYISTCILWVKTIILVSPQLHPPPPPPSPTNRPKTRPAWYGCNLHLCMVFFLHRDWKLLDKTLTRVPSMVHTSWPLTSLLDRMCCWSFDQRLLQSCLLLLFLLFLVHCHYCMY